MIFFIQKKLKEAVLLAGSQVALSRILHITEASLSQLLNNRFLPSARICVLLEAKFGFKKEQMRPDIFLID